LTGITIKYCQTWDDSRKRVNRFLKEKGYLGDEQPTIILNFVEDDIIVDDNILVLNRFVELIRDKILMNKLLDKFEIPHPLTYYYPFANLPKTPDDCVVKTQYGQEGKRIKFQTFLTIDRDELQDYNYVQAYIPFEKEYRVLVDFLGTFSIKEKVGEAKLKNSKSCKFRKRENQEIATFATQVCRKFGIDFAGLDIGEWNGKYYIIELNSAPCLSTKNAEIFANHLIGILYR